LYYLQSRYYNPEWGRFINADSITGVKGELLSHNMFAYSNNNPVNMSDQSGRLPIFLIPVITFLASWATAVMASPDLNTDIAAISTDIAEGNTVAAVIDTACAVVPALPAGGGTITKSLSKSTSLRRPYIRKSVRKAVESKAPKTASGLFIDPNTRKPIMGKYDLGHKRGNEFWREKAKAEAEGLTQKQFNDRMNNSDLYRIEDPASNRSHRYEQK
jgi:hypothetical protein